MSDTYSSIFRFADDAKIIKELFYAEDTINLQQDLDSLDHWCKIAKLTTMHFSLSSAEQPTLQYGQGAHTYNLLFPLKIGECQPVETSPGLVITILYEPKQTINIFDQSNYLCT